MGRYQTKRGLATISKVLNSESPQVRKFSSPKVLKFENQYNNYMCALKPVICTM